MRFGVLGTGMVGTAVSTRFVQLGHDVMMGARDAANEKAAAWVAQHPERASQGTFRDAALHGEIVVNATAGTASLDALQSAGAEALEGKILIDIANPLNHDGFPSSLSVCNTDSLGEQIQRAFPQARVVKALNTINASVMVDPRRIGDDHAVFICGDDTAAKAEVTRLLLALGWADDGIVDLGDISNSRGTEMYLGLWMRLMRVLGTPSFNVAIVRGV